MKQDVQAKIVCFGSEKFMKMYCDSCIGYAFVIDGWFTCCDKKAPKPTKIKTKRASIASASRLIKDY